MEGGGGCQRKIKSEDDKGIVFMSQETIIRTSATTDEQLENQYCKKKKKIKLYFLKSAQHILSQYREFYEKKKKTSKIPIIIFYSNILDEGIFEVVSENLIELCHNPQI